MARPKSLEVRSAENMAGFALADRARKMPDILSVNLFLERDGRNICKVLDLDAVEFVGSSPDSLLAAVEQALSGLRLARFAKTDPATVAGAIRKVLESPNHEIPIFRTAEVQAQLRGVGDWTPPEDEVAKLLARLACLVPLDRDGCWYLLPDGLLRRDPAAS